MDVNGGPYQRADQAHHPIKAPSSKLCEYHHEQLLVSGFSLSPKSQSLTVYCQATCTWNITMMISCSELLALYVQQGADQNMPMRGAILSPILSRKYPQIQGLAVVELLRPFVPWGLHCMARCYEPSRVRRRLT